MVLEWTEPDLKLFSSKKTKKTLEIYFSNLIINLSQCLNKDNTKTKTTWNKNNPKALLSFSQRPSLLISGKAYQREDYIGYVLFFDREYNCEGFSILKLTDFSISSCPEMHWSLHTSSQTLVICFDLLIWPRLISDQLVSHTESSSAVCETAIKNRLGAVCNVINW